MSITASGSITIVDVTDTGAFSVYPMSNMPLSVIYDPNNGSYTPNWGDSSTNLTLLPVMYYSSTRLSKSDAITVLWYRRNGTDAQYEITSTSSSDNEYIDTATGNLIVKANLFSTSIPMITYIVKATYKEPILSKDLVAEGLITFSLVKMASNAKTCIITGENVFKYDTNKQIIGSNELTLTGTVNNVTISQWQYYDSSSSSWIQYPGSTSSSTLTVKADDAVYSNDKVSIKLTTSDDNVYDVTTIVKIYDGAAGTDNISAVLSNDSLMIPCDSSGSPIEGAFALAYTTISIYDGGELLTDWEISLSTEGIPDGGYEWDATTRTCHVTLLNSDTASVTFTCIKTGYANIVKKFSLVKVKTGVDGVSPTIYSVEPASLVINRSTAGVLTPSSIIAYGYQTTKQVKSAYAGIFKIYVDNASDPVYTSSTSESSCTYALSSLSNSAKLFTVKLFESTTSTDALDSLTIVIVDLGATGDGALTVVLGNYADTISVDSDLLLLETTTIYIPFTAYKGITKIGCKLSDESNIPTLFGVTASYSASTSSTDGFISYTLTPTTFQSPESMNGTVSYVFKPDGYDTTVTQVYSWSINKAAKDGEDAYLFLLTTPGGYIFDNGSGTLTINGSIMKGSSDITDSVSSWEWQEYTPSESGGAYTKITDEEGKYAGSTTSVLTVYAAAVDSFESYKCIATLSSELSFTQYSSLIDKSDPLQSLIFSSIGPQILNGLGVGAIYCILYLNGSEVDPIKSTNFSTIPPSSPTEGLYYYYLDSTNQVALLKLYSGSEWIDIANPYAGSYTWSYRDMNNESISRDAKFTSGKVIYIDGSLINRKITIDCKAEL